MGLPALVLATLLFASYTIFIRWIGSEFGVFSLSWIRSLIIVFVLAMYMLLQKIWKPVSKTDYKWFILMTISGVISFVSYVVAINHISIATTLLVYYASLVISGYILGYIILKEQINGVKISSLLICLVGLSLIYSFSFERRELLYVVLASAVGLGTMGWGVFSKKLSSKYPLVEIQTIDFALMFLITLPLALILKEHPALPTLSLQWFGVVALTAVTIAGTLLMVYGFRHLQAQIAGLVLLLEIVFGTIIGWVFFQEILTRLTVLGGILILIGIALPNFKLTQTKAKL